MLAFVMPVTSATRFNWVPVQSAYAQAQTWTARQQALRESDDYLSSVLSVFTSAATDQTTGMMNLAAQAALKRTQAAATAKVQSVLNPTDTTSSPAKSASSTLTLADGTVVKDDPVQYLPGGSRLNLAAGTLTLSDGTVIDTATGAKKINLTV